MRTLGDLLDFGDLEPGDRALPCLRCGALVPVSRAAAHYAELHPITEGTDR